jgi:hypothetical protein
MIWAASVRVVSVHVGEPPSELAEIVINPTNYELAYSKSDFAFL